MTIFGRRPHYLWMNWMNAKFLQILSNWTESVWYPHIFVVVVASLWWWRGNVSLPPPPPCLHCVWIGITAPTLYRSTHKQLLTKKIALSILNDIIRNLDHMSTSTSTDEHLKDFKTFFLIFAGDCGNNQFKCRNGSDMGYCIDTSYECNRRAECYDGEDELACCRCSISFNTRVKTFN